MNNTAQALAAFSGGSFVPSAEDATRLAGLAAFAHIGPCTDQRREWVVYGAIPVPRSNVIQAPMRSNLLRHVC